MGAEARNNPTAQWARQTGGGSPYQIYDVYGRPVSIGDLILLGDSPTHWRVVETAPILDGNAPRGAMRITLAAGLVEAVQGGMPNPMVVKIRDVGEYMTPEQQERLKEELAKVRAQGEPPAPDSPLNEPTGLRGVQG